MEVVELAPLPGHPQRRPHRSRRTRPTTCCMAIEEELRRRRFGEAVRLEVERTMPAATRNLLLRGLGLEADDCYEITGMLDLTGALRASPTSTCRTSSRRRGRRSRPPRLVPPDDDEPADVFAAIRAGDILVHHPYESLRRIGRALHRPGRRRPGRPDDQDDALPDVAATRRSSASLIRAAERGKQVVGPRRDQGPLRRGGEHRLGAQAGARGRPRRLRAGRAQDPLEDRARRPPRGLRACAATSTSGPATTTPRRPGSTSTSAC